MAELLGASRERGGPGEGGPQSVHAADRSRMRELRRASRTRIRRWASADRPAVLHQLGLVAIRSTIARSFGGRHVDQGSPLCPIVPRFLRDDARSCTPPYFPGPLQHIVK